VSAGSRAVTTVIALAAFVVAVAFLVRAVVLATSDLTWRLPAWLQRLPTEPGWASAAAGAAAAALALLCLALLWRLATLGADGRRDFLVGEAERAVVVRVGAIERLLVHAIGRNVEQLSDIRVRVRTGDEGCMVSVAGLVGRADLAGIHGRVREVSQRELERAAGLQMVAVDLDVDGFSG
jgi:hypothetical protein